MSDCSILLRPYAGWLGAGLILALTMSAPGQAAQASPPLMGDPTHAPQGYTFCEMAARQPANAPLADARGLNETSALPAECAATMVAAQAKQLQAVMHGPRGAMALIDQQWLRRGDRHGDAQVAEIRKNSVVLITSGRREELFVGASRLVTEP